MRLTGRAASELREMVKYGVLGWPADPARRAAFEELRDAGLIERHGEAPGGVKLWHPTREGHAMAEGR